ncbi:hypothetical protein BOX15_Mlig029016g1 [Macrostomum lignano]|uniref:BZIP domain-containing protein n=1 Tax=Macrostomum lignano TaxID=282301 RepID=A0A267EIK3_9PLAT|nr:hypothetical protein BOX15_Mlig029016g3 [Macrostomum lignano]PAA55501.1 hypothetical protein BOX15_Mlig029016g2 [Macrostomum lignano]PAA60747.1 hypothetical protein BOX15_Mlig029016g1 [Macrostomum lignano]
MARKHVDVSDPQKTALSVKRNRGGGSSCYETSHCKRDSEPISYAQRKITDESIDLDSASTPLQLVTVKPKLEPQISVLSTDSGFLPRDIQDSSFVEDVMEELNSQGISHSDIICCHGCHAGTQERPLKLPGLAVSNGTPETACQKKSREACQRDLDGPSCKKVFTQKALEGQAEVKNEKRIKNNAASRKSRASRKMNTLVKEQEIAALQADNQRLAIVLEDFTSIAAACKQWIVRNMETPDT